MRKWLVLLLLGSLCVLASLYGQYGALGPGITVYVRPADLRSGSDIVQGSRVIGFACTANQCYIASQ